MRRITAAGFRQMMHDVDKMEDPITLMVWGPPGIGKSYTAEEVAAELGRVFVPWSLGRKEKYDVAGIPGKETMEDKDGKAREYTTWALPVEWKKVFDAGGKALVLFDEFTVAEENVQNAVLDIVLQKRVDTVDLPKNTMFVLCGNLGGDDGTFATSITTALSGGRGVVCDITPPSVQEWIDYETSHKGVYHGISGFLLDQPGHLWVGPKLDKPHDPWSCPRSWSQLNKIIREMNLSDDEDKLLGFAEGLLSSGTYIKFADYIKKNLISIERLISNDKNEWKRYFKIEELRRSSILRELWSGIRQTVDKNKRDGVLQEILDTLTQNKAQKETDENMLVFYQSVSADYLGFLVKGKVGDKKVGEVFDELKKRTKVTPSK